MNRGNLVTRFFAEANTPRLRDRRTKSRFVGAISCERCGAAILLDPDDPVNQIEAHNEWHEKLVSDIQRAADTYVDPPRYA